MTEFGFVDAVAGKRVLIFGINYSPEPTGIAPYTTGLAEQLALTAEAVTVLAGLPSYPAWTVDPAFRHWRHSESLNGVTLTRLWHFVPGKQTALLRGAYESTFLAHAAAVGRRAQADLVIAVTPALGGAVAAAIVAKRLGVPLVVIVQDLMGKAAAQSGISGGGSVAGATGVLEGWALRRAARVAVVSDAFRRAVMDYGVPAAKIDLLPNWSHIEPDPVDREAVRRGLGWAPHQRVALHTGNMGLKQNLGNVIEAARLAGPESDLLWVLMGDGSQRVALEAQAGGLANVRFLPPCASEDYAGILAAADVLVVNERQSVGDMSLPSKLTSYFMSSRPIAAAVSQDGATATELRRSGAALTCAADDPECLLAIVRQLISLDDHGLQLGYRGRSHALAHLTPGSAFARFNDICHKAIAPHATITTVIPREISVPEPQAQSPLGASA